MSSVYLYFKSGNWGATVLDILTPYKVKGCGGTECLIKGVARTDSRGESVPRPAWEHFVDTVAPLFANDSWMACGLLYTVTCTRAAGGCAVCARFKHPPAVPPAMHRVQVYACTSERRVVVDIDAELDTPGTDWAFVRLPGTHPLRLKEWIDKMLDTPYNFHGLYWNFLPSWMRRGCAPDPPMAQDAVFCSQLMTLFMLEFYPPAAGDAASPEPAESTPQMLFLWVRERFPQFQIERWNRNEFV